VTRRSSALVAALVGIALAFAIGRAVVRLPGYGESRGPYEQRRAIESVRARHATNLDAFVNFDLRGFDTLGEEFIFLVSVGGFALLLRERRDEIVGRERDASAPREPGEIDPVVRVASLVFVPFALVFGLYVVMHGQLTPGGGFQGGVALATGALAIFLGAGFDGYRRTVPKDAVEGFEMLGAFGYIAIGAAGLFAGGVFLRNFMPIGETGSLFSGGTIDALNYAVGMAVAGGFIVVFIEFLKETLATKDEPK
jgi:multicomponent Na+:H+ antiporter subunit B